MDPFRRIPRQTSTRPSRVELFSHYKQSITYKGELRVPEPKFSGESEGCPEHGEKKKSALPGNRTHAQNVCVIIIPVESRSPDRGADARADRRGYQPHKSRDRVTCNLITLFSFCSLWYRYCHRYRYRYIFDGTSAQSQHALQLMIDEFGGERNAWLYFGPRPHDISSQPRVT